MIIDETITLRADYHGLQGVYGVQPDLTVMGKIIGGGLPIGIFGGKKEIIEMIAPSGSVYQAGTYSGSPASVAAGLAVLAFSRDHEYDADKYSVNYLYKTSYDARGVGGFFEKINGAPQPPQFLSTHPNPDNRIERIEEEWTELGGASGNTYVNSYQDFINSLP